MHIKSKWLMFGLSNIWNYTIYNIQSRNHCIINETFLRNVSRNFVGVNLTPAWGQNWPHTNICWSNAHKSKCFVFLHLMWRTNDTIINNNNCLGHAKQVFLTKLKLGSIWPKQRCHSKLPQKIGNQFKIFLWSLARPAWGIPGPNNLRTKNTESCYLIYTRGVTFDPNCADEG